MKPMTLILLIILGAGGLSAQTNAHEEFATAVDFGRRFFEAGNYPAALTFYERADALFRDQPGVLFNTSLVLVRLQRYDEAQQRLTRYLQLFPSGAEVEAVRNLQREIQFALELTRRQRSEQEYRSFFNRGRFLAGEGEWEKALEAFRAAEQIFPGDPPLSFNLAVVNEQLGRSEEALSAYRRFLAAATGDATAEAKIFDLEREIVEMRTRLICPHCGEKLDPGARWCHRCWRGPYDTASGSGWEARSCASGAPATRRFYDAAGRVLHSEPLPCLYAEPSVHEFLRYSRHRQESVTAAREADGWTRADGVLRVRGEGSPAAITLRHGEFLRGVEMVESGEVHSFAASRSSTGNWVLTEEPYSVGAQLYTKSYAWDEQGRLSRESVYWESQPCRHFVGLTVSYAPSDGAWDSASVTGGYTGYRIEGLPKVKWKAEITRAFDASARLTREELNLVEFQKVLGSKPIGSLGAELRALYPGLKAKRPVELLGVGDFCGGSAANRLVEPIDLRSLYTLSPSLAVPLPPTAVKVVVDYPSSN